MRYTRHPRNPVAKSPLMRKGGAHQKSRSSRRRSEWVDVRDAWETWREAQDRSDADSSDRFFGANNWGQRIIIASRG
jgi:hypothetical protein